MSSALCHAVGGLDGRLASAARPRCSRSDGGQGREDLASLQHRVFVISSLLVAP